jgi:uncharacterized membrane protein YkvA (DUF1232 family)
MGKLRQLQRGFRKELQFYRLILQHERTPRITRIFLGAAIAYALSPIDLIPDWIPVVGHLDDVLIVPLLIWLGLRFVPSTVVEECRAGARAARAGSR